MPNRLIHETSPYLLQHAHNPVDWYAWGEEALARARAENKPILLSIGYSACHWCHVMERESFEDAATAALMNAHFVSVKVDREERPDLDNIYMTAVQGLTGQGGWPLTAFLTPDGVPFFGGTYFPPDDRQGMPSFRRVMLAVLDAYQNRRDDVLNSAQQVHEYLKRRAAMQGMPEMLTPALLDQATEGMVEGFDATWGGFGRAPKFPMPMGLDYLLRSAARKQDASMLNMVTTTLDHMARGGMYDQIGGGFHRYSTDARWLVPHFEKMLYDNAQLARLYLAAWQCTGNAFYRQIVEETLDYVVREMTSAEGGFASTQDADSEGEEGKFYVWTPLEVEGVLGPRAALIVGRYYDVTPGGNFEGKNIFWTPRPAEAVAESLGISVEELMATVQRARPLLYAARGRRVHPGLDDKVLTAWNGMMLRAFAEAAAVLERPDYEAVAVKNAGFLLRELVRDGRVLRTYKDGRAHLNGYLEDYANLADGLLALYETTFDRRWLDEARSLSDRMLERFWDDAVSGFYDTSSDHEALVTRPRDIFDNATPSGNAVAVDALLRLAEHTGERRYRERAEAALRGMASLLVEHASGFGRWLAALDFALSTVKEIALVGDFEQEDMRELLRAVRRPYLPNKVVAAARPGDAMAVADLPLLSERPQLEGRATAYVCQNYTCNLPVTDAAALAAQLR